jgi:RIO kinase 1
MSTYPDFDEQEDFADIRNISEQEKRLARRFGPGRKQPRPSRPARASELPADLQAEQDQDTWIFTYQASRHERQWLKDSLGGFFEHQWFQDVLRLLKGGKEASVYQCTANPPIQTEFLAAKVYRPRMFRGLRNDQAYRAGRADLDGEGRVITDDGMLHAMRKRTTYGKELLHTSWIEHEFKAMQVLHRAGADVPSPYACANNAILMDYIGDENGPAPILTSVRLGHSEAQRIFQGVVHNIELMLANGLVHADLSAYNILYWEGEIVLIDFPQVVQPHVNQNAYAIFQRDVHRVCEYFQEQGVRVNAARLARDLWKGRGFPTAPEPDLSRMEEE